MPIPANYRDTGPWVAAKPSLSALRQHKAWWTVYQDPTLNLLEQRVSCGNENLKVALARFQEACAVAQSTRSHMYPTILAQGTAVRQQNSSGPIINTNQMPSILYNLFVLTAMLNYEVDAWGRVRNAVIASDSLARASEFDLAAIDLSMHAALAANYFELRGDEAAQKVLDRTVVARPFNLEVQQWL